MDIFECSICCKRARKLVDLIKLELSKESEIIY